MELSSTDSLSGTSLNLKTVISNFTFSKLGPKTDPMVPACLGVDFKEGRGKKKKKKSLSKWS